MSHFTQTSCLSAAISVAILLSACSSDTDRHPATSPADEALNLVVVETEKDDISELISAKALMNDHRVRMESVALSAPQALMESSVFMDAYSTPKVLQETYAHYPDNKTQRTLIDRVSTFSIDVDTGAYSNMRRHLEAGSLPPADAIRAEELINYFTYNYTRESNNKDAFSINTELAPNPWGKNTHLLRIGLAGNTTEQFDEKSANLVFLIDVSGSMNSPDKLGLLTSSISMLSNELDKNDKISIVVYAGSSGIALEPTQGNNQAKIHSALAKLTAGGSTNGVAGIELAYQIASENFIADGVNRVILATDGDFNVGISDVKTLKQLIAKKRDSGIALTTLGFGRGNYNDHLMEQLAQEGNGNYAYIDKLSEARKVLVDELSASLLTIAKDVKVQVEFNPATVSEYRLIGYTNRQLNDDDFDNDKVDAGEVGAGHTVTALYEISLVGYEGEKHTANRYESKPPLTLTEKLDEIANIRLRFKQPDSNESQLLSQVVQLNSLISVEENTSDDFRFAASVAAFAQTLKGSDLPNMSYEQIKALAMTGRGEDPYGYRQEFIRLVDIANTLQKIDNAAWVGDTSHDQG